ncbi:MAG: hypothetical protein KUG79_09705 [Pseudomonadales bacterium]|nr:hypothetical protein [Pseudomonadales bacterium]
MRNLFTLTCKQVSESASDYIEQPNIKHLGSFSASALYRKLVFRCHLFMCINCRRYIKQLKLTIAAIQIQTFEIIQPATPDEDRKIDALVKKLITRDL